MPALALLLSLAITGPGERQVGVPIGQGKKKPRVTLTEPRGGWTVDRMITVTGTVSDSTVDPVVLSINGDRYLMRTYSGSFSRAFPSASGKNIITVMATNQGGTGSAQATTYAQVPAVPLKAILTSDTEGVWTDLHIWEPTNASQDEEGKLKVESMAHVFWANTESPSGGTFFLNEQGGNFDQPAYGPYLYVHRAPPKGTFLIAANYWPSGDKAHTIATLNVVMFEGTAQEVKRKVQVPLATPGTTRVLAWINVVDAGKALLYVPGQDAMPNGNGWPTNLNEVTKVVTTQGM
jgi:uncharacterized protein YfaP (DUF2135 family)